MAAPRSLDLTESRAIRRGDTYDLPLVFQTTLGVAVNLTGRTYSAQLRPHPASSTSVSFVIDTADLAIGRIILHLDASASAVISPGVWVWDLQETLSPTQTRTLIEGDAYVIQDVTRG